MGRGKMRNILITVLAAAAFFAVPFCSFAAPVSNVANTPHNLSTTGPGSLKSTDETEICVFCHTPHNANPAVPLWNHYSTTAKTFLLYTASPTLDMTKPDYPKGLAADSISRLCLTCHDGTTAFNTLVNPSGSLGTNPGWDDFALTFEIAGVYAEGEGPYLGTDLTRMHPIGFDYTSAAADTEIYTIDTPKGQDLKFFGPGQNLLECPTCHNPHVDYNYNGISQPEYGRYDPFLRKSNKSSNLCFACHDK